MRGDRYPLLQAYVCGGKHQGLDLQTLGSGIMRDALGILAGRVIAALSQHDSVGWLEEHRDKVRDLKEDIYEWHMGFKMALNWRSWRPD